MNRSGWSVRLSRAALALSIVSAGGAIAAERVEKGPITKTPAVVNGQEGMWVEYTEYVFQEVDWEARIRALYTKVFGSVTITDAQVTALAQQGRQGQLTLAGLETQLNTLKTALTASAFNSDSSQAKAKQQRLEAQFKTGYHGDYAGSNENSTLNLADRFLTVAKAIEAGLYDFSVSGFTFSGSHGLSGSAHTSSLNSSFQAYFQEYRQDVLSTGTHSSTTLGGTYTITVKNLTAAKAYEIALDLYQLASRTVSPIAFDLNHDGKIGVTGKSSAKVRNYKNAFVPGGSVVFDLVGKGKAGRFEWLNGDGDGFLVDDRDGKVTKAAQGDGMISGLQLFGNAGGYAHGFHKLAMNFDRDVKLTANAKTLPAGYGKLTGDELKGLKVWVDANRDAKVQPSELKTLAQLGITEIGSTFDMVKNADGELLMQSHYFVQHGKKHLSEDVWFAQDPSELN
jgi:hypothetical protein